MKNYRSFLYLVLLNLFLSLLVVFFSPRFDLLTLFGFLLVNALLLFLLIRREKKREDALEERIDEIFSLLYASDLESDCYEVTDDAFGNLHDEIIKILSENKRMADSAEKNKEVLREYIEDIAHQIKSPLTGSLLMLDLLEEDMENYDEYVKRLRGNLVRLLNLVDILLKLATLDAGALEMKREAVSARELLQEICENLEMYFQYDKEHIPVYGDDFTLMCDRNWTYEAVFNLIKNGIEVSRDRRLNIYLKETHLYQSILIEDFSPGLDGEALKKAFKRFYKSDPSSEGYGIGLPMAKSAIEKQGGDLLYSKGKTSNTFEVRFYK
ncbi:MAG: HAMP domain-containing sensor histidine kinase [Peptoniphilus sp.]|nr:HAMP domain-containing sensor histidine kinase [Peptoniphilus sp.]MDY6045382.1 HAMP domain-containing sensor histidine kinase [Peptoniphilus sp.]